MSLGTIASGVFAWLGNNVMDEVINTTVRAGIATLTNKNSFKDNFKDQAILTAADAAYGAFRGQKPTAGTTPVQIPAPQAAPPAAPDSKPYANNPLQITNDRKKWDDLYGITSAPSGGISTLVNNQQLSSPDKRGFFESMGDVVGGDPEYSRWESAKQAFLPDQAGSPDNFRKYGPMIGAGLMGAYLGGAFDPETVHEAPNRPVSQGKQNVFSRPGMYRPGVPIMFGRAMGGHVSGPGTGTSDDIPANLSDGEFIMTSAAVRGAGGGDRQRGMQTMYNIMHDFERRA